MGTRLAGFISPREYYMPRSTGVLLSIIITAKISIVLASQWCHIAIAYLTKQRDPNIYLVYVRYAQSTHNSFTPPPYENRDSYLQIIK